MHKKLLILSAVVLILAVGSVALVAYQWLSSPGDVDQQQAEALEPREPELQEELLVEAAPIVPARKVEMPLPDPVDEEAAELPEMMGFEEEPEEPAPEETKERVRQLLATMTPEEKKELSSQLTRERQRQHRDQRRYYLRTQMALNSLRWYRDANLKLTGLQKEQIKNVLEPMKPRMKITLGDNWAREDELRDQIRELYRQGRRDEAPPLSQELQTLRKNTAELKKQFDEEFGLQLQDILTPEQGQWLKKRTGSTQFFGVAGHRR